MALAVSRCPKDRSEASSISLLEALGIPDAGRGLTMVHDGNQAIASALSFILPKAESRSCVWHQLHNVFLKARGLFHDEPNKVKEAIQVAKMQLETPKPRTTSQLERGIKEYRRCVRPMDGFKFLTGAADSLKVWSIKENARMAIEAWLKTVVN